MRIKISLSLLFLWNLLARCLLVVLLVDSFVGWFSASKKYALQVPPAVTRLTVYRGLRVAVWLCCSVSQLLYCCVALSLCCCVAALLRCSISMLQCCRVAVLLYCTLTFLLCHRVVVLLSFLLLLCCCGAVLLCCVLLCSTVAVLLHDCVAELLCCGAAVLLCCCGLSLFCSCCVLYCNVAVWLCCSVSQQATRNEFGDFGICIFFIVIALPSFSPFFPALFEFIFNLLRFSLCPRFCH